MNRPQLARADYDTARVLLETKLREQPQDERLHSSLGIAYAGLGRVKEAIREVMSEELRQVKNYTITDEPGPGVLKVTMGLIDVVSRVPPERISARSSYYLSDLGSAVLIMEIRDSRTNEALARIADGRNVQPLVAKESNPVTNLMEVKRSVRVWGRRIRTGLDELHELGCYVCVVPGSIEN